MEIPSIYRETKTRVEFAGRFKQIVDKATGRICIYFKYPGGEIPYLNGEDFLYRLINKGFGEDEIDKIISLLVGTVATEATVAHSEVSQSVF